MGAPFPPWLEARLPAIAQALVAMPPGMYLTLDGRRVPGAGPIPRELEIEIARRLFAMLPPQVRVRLERVFVGVDLGEGTTAIVQKVPLYPRLTQPAWLPTGEA